MSLQSVENAGYGTNASIIAVSELLDSTSPCPTIGTAECGPGHNNLTPMKQNTVIAKPTMLHHAMRRPVQWLT